MNEIIFNKEGVYNRNLTLYITKHECDICKEQKKVIEFDGSECEYGSIYLCKRCITKLCHEELI